MGPGVISSQHLTQRRSDHELVALTEQAGVVDCVHYGAAVLVDKKGIIRWSVGNPRLVVFERSTTKPLRALAVLRSGCVDRFRLDEADIALIAGSHSGTCEHVRRAAAIAQKVGLSEDNLQCGVRLPIGEDAIYQLLGSHQKLSVLHCDCSGEHLGALAVCKHCDYSLTTYLHKEHPVQRLFKETVDEFSNDDRTVATTTDRCGMPTSAIELAAVALRFSRLILARSRDASVDRLFRAINKYPTVYTGQGRIVGALIERSQGGLFGKCGAEGLYAIAWPSGESLALKIADGSVRAAIPLIVRAATELALPIPDVWDCINGRAFADVRLAKSPNCLRPRDETEASL